MSTKDKLIKKSGLTGEQIVLIKYSDNTIFATDTGKCLEMDSKFTIINKRNFKRSIPDEYIPLINEELKSVKHNDVFNKLVQIIEYIFNSSVECKNYYDKKL